MEPVYIAMMWCADPLAILCKERFPPQKGSLRPLVPGSLIPLSTSDSPPSVIKEIALLTNKEILNSPGQVT